MPASSTYTPIQTISPTTNPVYLTFNNIPQIYTDLVLVVYGRSAVGGGTGDLFSITTQNNSSVYSQTIASGNGSTLSSTRNTNQPYWLFNIAGTGTTAGVYTAATFHFLNYRNTTTFKNVIARIANDLNGSGTTNMSIGLVRDTANITKLELGLGNLFGTGTMATLYGIEAA